MKTPTHVEFEDEDNCLHVVRREELSLFRGEDGIWSAILDADDWCVISPETAARLRRELVGEPEAASGPAAEPEFEVAGWGVVSDSEGLVAGTAERENAEAVQKMHRPRSGRVVPLYIRREDARP